MVTFHNTVTLKAEIQVIHTGYPDFFHLNIYIFCVALASTKHKLKRGVALPVSSQNDKKKGQFRLQSFCMVGLQRVSRKAPF